MAATDRDARMELGKDVEERFKLHLEKMGFIVTRTGQEKWLDSRQHEIIRHVHGNVTVDFVRHFPNFVVIQPSTKWCFLAEAKGTSETYRKGENFSIERACFENLRRINAIGVNVLVAFENRENEFFGQWIQNVPVKHFDPFETSRYFCGSGTPAALIIKKELPPIDSILRKSLPFEKSSSVPRGCPKRVVGRGCEARARLGGEVEEVGGSQMTPLFSPHKSELGKWP